MRRVIIGIWARPLRAAAILGAGLAALGLTCSQAPPVAEFTISVPTGPAPLEVGFTPSANEEGLSFSWDFGDGTGSDEMLPLHIFRDSGEFTTRLIVTRGEATAASEQPITVSPGAAGWVTIAPAVATVTAGDVVRFTASAFDELGNPVPDADIAWRADSSVGEIGVDGAFTSGGRPGAANEGVTAIFERLGRSGTGVAAITVMPGALAMIELEPAELEVAAGKTIALAARLLDAKGNELSGGERSWEVLREGDEISEDGEFTAGRAAVSRAGLVRATARLDGAEASASAWGSILPDILDRIEVEPPDIALQVGETQTFSVAGYDKYDNPVALESLRWTLLSPDAGEVDQTGYFTAGLIAGDFTDNFLLARATAGKITLSANVPLTVEPGPADSIEVTPPMDSVARLATSPMSSVVRDAYGNPISGADVRWSALAGGSITEAGVFRAGEDAGVFSDAIAAVLAAGEAGNERELTATASVEVRERSSELLAVELFDQRGGQIALVDLTSGDVRTLDEELLGNGARELGPAWRPDGSRLAFASDQEGLFQVYEVDPATLESRRLTDDPVGAVMPNWSPDNRSLAYVSISAERWQVYVADAAPGPEGLAVQAVQVSDNPDSNHFQPRWSPDGRKLLFTSDGGGAELLVMMWDRDSGEVRTITEPGEAELAFAWMPGKSRVLIGANPGPNGFDLVIVDVETGEREEIDGLPFPVLAAAPSPDGSELAVLDGLQAALWFMDTDGTGLRQVMGPETGPRVPDWRPLRRGG